jgi:AcrR family transcriptional regulator
MTMPTQLNPAAHALKRDAFLDAAERLIRTKGYEQMTVQDVLDDLGASKGAFYHYFDSKSVMLEAVIERMTDAVMAVITPIAADPTLSAPARLQAVFRAGGQWKAERRELMLGIVRAWYSDENALVRERLWASMNNRLVPLIARIIRQGAAEGALSATSPDHAAAILMGLLECSGADTGRLFMAHLDGGVSFEEVERTVGAYNEAIERILGLPTGSFEIVESPILQFWFA